MLKLKVHDNGVCRFAANLESYINFEDLSLALNCSVAKHRAKVPSQTNGELRVGMQMCIIAHVLSSTEKKSGEASEQIVNKEACLHSCTPEIPEVSLKSLWIMS